MTRRRWLGAVAAALAIWLGTGTLPAPGHATLVKATPAARSTVAQNPSRVELLFNERLEPAYATVSVWDAAGTQVDLGDAGLAPDDRRRLHVGLPPLDPGRYTVRYRVLSVDGHIVEASFVFTVAGAPR